jgi:YegS/Rv2252/BmrU family lipid kinase
MAEPSRQKTRDIILIANPVAGRKASAKIEKAVGILEKRHCNVEVLLTSKRGDAEAYARDVLARHRFWHYDTDLLHAHLPLVIVAGGDGTYNEVANGLVHTRIPMAILPLGTTSVLAEELKIPHNIEKALDIALSGSIQTVHLGRITFLSQGAEDMAPDAAKTTRHFLLMAGIGFDGEAVRDINEQLKQHTGKGAYVVSGIAGLLQYQPQPIEITAHNVQVITRQDIGHGGELRLTGYVAIVGKAACYGGKFKITPDARLSAPYLHAFVTHSKGRLDLLRYVGGIVTGTHLNYRDVSYFRTNRVEINGHAHIQIDGDYAGTTPATINVVPDALRLVSNAYDS